MKIPISGETEFEASVQQIDDGQKAMALQTPYTDIQIVTIAENLIETTVFTQLTVVDGIERIMRRKLG